MSRCSRRSNPPGDATGRYKSSLKTDSISPTANLLGYYKLRSRQPEAKFIALNANINGDSFPELIAKTQFNLELVRAISNVIATLPTFKNQLVTFNHMEHSGSLAQLVMTTPESQTDTLNVDDSVKPTCAERLPSLMVIMSVVFEYNMYKEGKFTTELYKNWCCAVNKQGQTYITQA